MAGAGERDELRAGMDTRDVIGQAKGVLMERYKITADQAFMLLIGSSQRTHLKLRDVAEQLTATGELAGA
jgi:AmiR/NasT family two-component response regulator